MARLQNRPVVLRFVLGKGAVKARRDFETSANLIVRNIAVAAAEGEFELVRDQISEQIRLDLDREVQHLASMFGRFIIGAPGTRDKPTGTLDTVSKGDGRPSMNLGNALPAWHRRSRDYLEKKRRTTGGIAWFDNSARRVDYYSRSSGKHIQRKTRAFNREGGYLKQTMTNHGVWLRMFGPILVRFRRSQKATADRIAGTPSAKTRLTVGTMYITAFNKVTTSMIHAGLTTNVKLQQLVAGADQGVANRLFGRKGSPYRPTLEPFLDFFLTRALPFAVNERLKRGMKQGTLLKN